MILQETSILRRRDSERLQKKVEHLRKIFL